MKVAVMLGLILLSGCFSGPNADGCDPDASARAFKSEKGQYKKEVLRDTAYYRALKEFIYKNLDSLIAYQNRNCIATTYDEKGQDINAPCDNDCYTFADYGTGNNIKDQVPSELYPELTSIYTHFNSQNFHHVSFCKDGTVTILLTAAEDYNDKWISVNHRIIFSKRRISAPVGPGAGLYKDTLLANGGVYTVHIDCYQGI